MTRESCYIYFVSRKLSISLHLIIGLNQPNSPSSIINWTIFDSLHSSYRQLNSLRLNLPKSIEVKLPPIELARINYQLISMMFLLCIFKFLIPMRSWASLECCLSFLFGFFSLSPSLISCFAIPEDFFLSLWWTSIAFCTTTIDRTSSRLD